MAMGDWPLALSVAGWTAGGVAAGKPPTSLSPCLTSRRISLDTDNVCVVGSIAAGVQAAIRNVTAESAFAVTQSAAMGGAAGGVVNVVIAGAGVGAAATQWYGGCEE
jgi:hypothetical protein